VAKGKVYLVGAGPGDRELLTLKAERVLREADVILYDRLIGDEIVSMLRESGKKLIYVGKNKGERGDKRQEEINRLMKKYADEGKKVVRLKGGDPIIFGRATSEIEFLIKNSIPFEIIPGVSSVNGVPAYANIPLTHPELASCLIVLTGKEDMGKFHDLLNRSTFVILMGKDSVRDVAKGLVKFGLDAETGVAVIQRGTLRGQKVFFCKLGELSKCEEEFEGPALIVVGRVVDFVRELNDL
jgi:uroporphyrin-III C-methyltransferase